MRQSSSRNQRSRGLRVKHFLQFCLLIAVSIWLLYQLKHSYNKKHAVEERGGSVKVASSRADIFDFGRKDLQRSGGAPVNTRKTVEEQGELEEEKEHFTKQEAVEGDARGGGDDEINETEEREEEKADERGGESVVEENKDAEAEGTEALDEEEHEGNSREAREEHYRRDDASSAVRHDTPKSEVEFGNEANTTAANEKVDGSGVSRDADTSARAVDAVNGNASSTNLGGNVTAPIGSLSVDETAVENEEPEVGVSELGTPLVSNSTSVEYGSQREPQMNSTALAETNNQIGLQNGTATDAMIIQTKTWNNTTDVDTARSSDQDRNATVDTGTTGEDKPDMAAAVPELTEKTNTSLNGDVGHGGSSNLSQTEKSNTGETSDAAQGESSKPLPTEKASENEDAVQGELENPSDDPVATEEKEARTHLSTLPDVQIEAMTDENEAAE